MRKNAAPRKWQIHLSTALVLTVVIGVLLALNFNITDHGYFKTFGFPLRVYWPGSSNSQTFSGDGLIVPLEVGMLLADVACAAALIYGAYALAEKRVRRGEAGKT